MKSNGKVNLALSNVLGPGANPLMQLVIFPVTKS